MTGVGAAFLGHAHDAAEDQAEEYSHTADELADELTLSVKREHEARRAPEE